MVLRRPLSASSAYQSRTTARGIRGSSLIRTSRSQVRSGVVSTPRLRRARQLIRFATTKEGLVNSRLHVIRANLLRAEVSWPIIKQVRSWWWSWREERVSNRLERATERTQHLTQYRKELRIAAKLKQQALEGKKTGTASSPKRIVFEQNLRRVSKRLEKYAPILEAKIDEIEELSRFTAGRTISSSKLSRLRTLIEDNIQDADPRAAAERFLETDFLLDQINTALQRNRPNSARKNFDELLSLYGSRNRLFSTV